MPKHEQPAGPYVLRCESEMRDKYYPDEVSAEYVCATCADRVGARCVSFYSTRYTAQAVTCGHYRKKPKNNAKN